MTDEELKQAMAELQEVVRCRCDEAYRDRGLKDPHCECDSAEAVKIVARRLKDLTEQLTAAQRDAKEAEAYAEELEKELNTCRMAQAVMDNTVAGLKDGLNLMMTERDEAWKRAAHAEKMWGEAEVKLAKAVDAINVATRHEPKGLYPDHVPNYWLLRTTLAEIKGESHD